MSVLTGTRESGGITVAADIYRACELLSAHFSSVQIMVRCAGVVSVTCAVLCLAVSCAAAAVTTSSRTDGGITRARDDGSCRTPDRKPGRCVNLRQCPELVSLLRSGRPGSREFMQRALCGYDMEESLEPEMMVHVGHQIANLAAA
ncbi:hypothetical protein B566_EDAN017780 [Ephemera danica]|nr:hypothetical protein B566_EDAN017780 [Ephemera danica]